MGLRDFTIYDGIKHNAKYFPKRPAWLEISNGRMLNFEEFRNVVDHLAAGLQQSGIKRGDRIGVLGRNSLEYFLLYAASSALGAIVLPINWRLSASEVLYILTDGSPRFLFLMKSFKSWSMV